MGRQYTTVASEKKDKDESAEGPSSEPGSMPKLATWAGNWTGLRKRAGQEREK